MYTQELKRKNLNFLGIIAATVIIVLFVSGLYVLFSISDSAVSPTSAAAGALLIILLAGYFILKPSLSTYIYCVTDEELTIKQLTSKRIVKNITLKRADITDIRKGKGGMRLYPVSKNLYTFTCNQKKYTVAPDAAMLSYLENSSFTDAYIDASYDSMIEELKNLIAIPSVKEAPVDDKPFGVPCAEALAYTLSLCQRLGMRTKNLENYCGWAEIGEGEKLIAILCHLDVVPAGDGWKTDPFTAFVTEKEIFGRGAIDDKGPAIAAIYGVNAIKEKYDTVPCRIRLIFGCDEESGWACMDRYSKTEENPNMAFTPDGSYPVIITEKGIAHISLHTSLEEGDYQLYIKGGLRPNMVPDKATATVIGNIDKLFDVLNGYDVHSKGINFTAKGDTLEIEACGAGAHGSTPNKGKNAFFELFNFLQALDLKRSQGEFINSMVSLFVNKCDGSGTNLELKDELSGALTQNLGICFIGKNELYPQMNDDSCRIVLDIRYPISYDINDISARLQSALPPTWECEIDHYQAPHHVQEDSLLVQTLMDVYKSYTGRDEKPLAIGGGTYARTLPGKAVAFGVEFPDEEEKAHQANESMSLHAFKISAKMFAAAIEKLLK